MLRFIQIPMRVLGLFVGVVLTVVSGLSFFPTPVLAASCCPTGNFYCPGAAGSGGGCFSDAGCTVGLLTPVCGGDATQNCSGGANPTCVVKTTNPTCPTAMNYPVHDTATGVDYCCQDSQSPVGSAGCKRLTVAGTCSNSGGLSYSLNPATGLCMATGPALPAGKKNVFLCLTGSCQTAIGTVGTNPTAFVGAILKLVMGLAGGIALIMIIIAGYQVLTSTGDPAKLNSARELLLSVFTGIILIVLSLVLLQTIGVDILRIPALGGTP